MTVRIINTVSVLLLILVTGCTGGGFDNPLPAGREPSIEPDYTGITIPPNVAPLNFIISEKGERFRIKVTAGDGSVLTLFSSDGVVKFTAEKWNKLLSSSRGGKMNFEVVANNGSASSVFSRFIVYVADDPVDPYICYRLLYPGYRSWVGMKVVERSLENFSQRSVFENQMMDNNCVNCHTFNKNSPERFMIHVRGSKGGTYFYDGVRLTRKALKTKEMKNNTVYPDWHPSGRFVAFSSNKTVQSFHMRPEKNIEVYDLNSSMVLYDVEKNQMSSCQANDTAGYMETFPCWSADGDYLYYCRAARVSPDSDYTRARYDLCRRPFDAGRVKFGKAELVFDAGKISKSVSFPEISPDGNYLVFTLHDYGTFSIWHWEADLYLLDLKSGSVSRMDLNSDETESWHCWSANGKWIVFSSKRMDGLTARPFFSYFYSPDSTGKPFVLPQEDPSLYHRLEKTFNRPEFVTGPLIPGPRDFARASGEKAVVPAWNEIETDE